MGRRNNVSIHTLNMRNQLNNYTNAAEFSNNNTNWTTGSWANINQDQAALDAHWAGEMVFDYWHNVHNRNSIDGGGIPVIGYVHFYVPNSPVGWPDNAAWVPGNNNHFMEYGDGDGTTFRPFVALDIDAHEFGHGVNEFTSNLGTVNQNQEEDALNEGLSDIWGISVKNFAAPNKPLWFLGGEILLNSAYNCIRNAQDPKSTLAEEGRHPNTYHGQYWSSTGEPHTNSTVLSHWFYLLSQGGSGTNDNSNAYNVNGLGINEAQQIVYQAEAHHLQPGDEYADARNAMIDAATDLYCANSPEVVAVTNAWYAVGVGTQSTAGMSITGSPSTSICNTSTYAVINQPAGITSRVWSIDNSYLASINSTTGVATRIGDGTANVLATVTGTGNCKTSLTIPVIVGNPLTGTINQGGVLTSMNTINSVSAGATSVSFQWPNVTGINCYQSSSNPSVSQTGFIYYAYNNSFWFTLSSGQSITVSFSGTGCGGTTIATRSFTVGGHYYVISPNPAASSINITPNSPVSNIKTESAQTNTMTQVSIMDVNGSLMKQQQFSGNTSKMHLNVADLIPGTYFVQIINGSTIETDKLIISR